MASEWVPIGVEVIHLSIYLRTPLGTIDEGIIVWERKTFVNWGLKSVGNTGIFGILWMSSHKKCNVIPHKMVNLPENVRNDVAYNSPLQP